LACSDCVAAIAKEEGQTMCIWCGRSGNDVFTDSVNKIVWKNLMNLNFICPNARNAHNESDDEQEKNIEQLK